MKLLAIIFLAALAVMTSVVEGQYDLVGPLLGMKGRSAVYVDKVNNSIQVRLNTGSHTASAKFIGSTVSHMPNQHGAVTLKYSSPIIRDGHPTTYLPSRIIINALMHLQLPNNMSVDRIKWLAIWNETDKTIAGHTQIQHYVGSLRGTGISGDVFATAHDSTIRIEDCSLPDGSSVEINTETIAEQSIVKDGDDNKYCTLRLLNTPAVENIEVTVKNSDGKIVGYLYQKHTTKSQQGNTVNGGGFWGGIWSLFSGLWGGIWSFLSRQLCGNWSK